MIKDSLKKMITDEVIETRDEFNCVNYLISKFRGFIFDEKGEFLDGGEEVYNFIKKQRDRLVEIDARPRNYDELYDFG